MNVPTFTGFNKAVFVVFFCICVQSHSQQAGGQLWGNGGRMTYLSNTAKPFHLYKNTFLQLTSRFLHRAKDLSHHCIARNRQRYVMQDQCPSLQANSPAGNKRWLRLMTPLNVPSRCNTSNHYTNLCFPDLRCPEEISDSAIMRENPPAERKMTSKRANTRGKCHLHFGILSSDYPLTH